jgi:hypothetical protein
MNFMAPAINFGENDLEDVHLNLDILKNNQSVFSTDYRKRDVGYLFNRYSLNCIQILPDGFWALQINWEYKSQLLTIIHR